MRLGVGPVGGLGGLGEGGREVGCCVRGVVGVVSVGVVRRREGCGVGGLGFGGVDF